MLFKTSLCIYLCLFAILASSYAEDGDSAFSADVNLGFFTDYMFRGVNLYDGVSIQPEVDLAYDFGEWGSIGGSAWAHLSGEGGSGASDKFTEVDYILNYDISFGLFGLSLGHIWYTFPEDDDGIANTSEFFGALSLDTFLSPTFTAYQDYREFDNQYYELEFSHELAISQLGDGFNVTPYLIFAFAGNAEKAYADNGLVHVTFGTSFDAKLGDITVTPSLNVTRESDDVADNEFWVGTNFGMSL